MVKIHAWCILQPPVSISLAFCIQFLIPLDSIGPNRSHYPPPHQRFYTWRLLTFLGRSSLLLGFKHVSRLHRVTAPDLRWAAEPCHQYTFILAPCDIFTAGLLKLDLQAFDFRCVPDLQPLTAAARSHHSPLAWTETFGCLATPSCCRQTQAFRALSEGRGKHSE